MRERRLVELTLARRRPRDHWRRYRFLTDAAQAFVEAGGASLAEFVAWVTAQADGRADRVETVLREADDDAVRIMTVHGSKGLEFPVVVLAGLNADPNTQSPLVAWGPERPEIRFGNRDDGYFETAGYLDVREADQRFEDAEQRRLLYVAATRAQDHLVVSLHHKPGYRNHAALLLRGLRRATATVDRVPEDTQLSLALEPPGSVGADGPGGGPRRGRRVGRGTRRPCWPAPRPPVSWPRAASATTSRPRSRRSSGCRDGGRGARPGGEPSTASSSR